MKLINRIVVILGILFFFIGNSFSVENKIIIKINNEIITTIDINNEINYLKTLNPNIKSLNKDQIYNIGKNSLIREKIKKIEILKYMDDIKLEKDYLDSLIKSRYTKLNIKSKDQFLEYLSNNDVYFQTIENKLSIEAVWNELIISKFSSKLKINKKKLREQIKVNSNQKLKEYLLSEIIFDISNNKNLEDKYKEIENSVIEIGFENTALTYSISNTSDIGGKLGWIREDSLNKKIIQNLKNLKKGDITKPIFTPSGYIILKIEDIKLIKKNYDIEKELNNLIRLKTNQQLSQYSNNYFNRIKKDQKINEF